MTATIDAVESALATLTTLTENQRKVILLALLSFIVMC
jgi:hypothetical protein